MASSVNGKPMLSISSPRICNCGLSACAPGHATTGTIGSSARLASSSARWRAFKGRLCAWRTR